MDQFIEEELGVLQAAYSNLNVAFIYGRILSMTEHDIGVREYSAARAEEFRATARTVVDLFPSQVPFYISSTPGEKEDKPKYPELNGVTNHLEVVALDLVRARHASITVYEQEVNSPKDYTRNVAEVALRAVAAARMEHEKIVNAPPPSR